MIGERTPVSSGGSTKWGGIFAKPVREPSLYQCRRKRFAGSGRSGSTEWRAATRDCGIVAGSASSANLGNLAPARRNHCAARSREVASTTLVTMASFATAFPSPASLGTLSRGAGEWGPSPKGLVGEGSGAAIRVEELLPLHQLRDLGIAADAFCQREGDFAGVVVDKKFDRHATIVEPHRIFGTAVELVFDGCNVGTLELDRRFLTAIDVHLLEFSGIGPHHRIGVQEIRRPGVGRVNGPRCREGALWRGDDKVVAMGLTFHLHGTSSLIGDAAKRNEAIPLPTLGTFSIFAVHANAEHLYFEMRLGFDRDAVPGRLDGIGVRGVIAEHRVANVIDELSRAFRLRGAGDQQAAEQDGYRHGEPCQWVRSRIHVALLETFPSTDARRYPRPLPSQASHGFNDPLTHSTLPASAVQTKYR